MAVILTLVPHDEPVFLVHCDCPFVEVRLVLFQQLKELDGQLFAALASAKPDAVEVTDVTDVLGYSDSEI